MNKIELEKLPTAKEALSRIRTLEAEFFMRYKRYTNCDIYYGLSGNKPNFIHDITLRYDPKFEEEAILVKNLYKEIYE